MHTLHFKLTSHINLSLTLCLLYMNVRYHRSKFNHMSMLKALIRRSRSPTLAAWKSSGWFMRERAIRRAAQMLLDITWWLLLFLCWCRAVRKLFTASLQEKREVKHANIKLNVFFSAFCFNLFIFTLRRQTILSHQPLLSGSVHYRCAPRLIQLMPRLYLERMKPGWSSRALV